MLKIQGKDGHDSVAQEFARGRGSRRPHGLTPGTQVVSRPLILSKIKGSPLVLQTEQLSKGAGAKTGKRSI